MKRRRIDLLVRAYPQSWRERYGSEFRALLEDTARDGRLGLREQLNTLRGALGARLRAAGLIGDEVSPLERIRTGVLVVMGAFAVFACAGIGLQKLSEHWPSSIAGGGGKAADVATMAYTLIQVAGGLASAAVVLGATLAIPAILRMVRTPAWRKVRGKVYAATAISTVTLAVGTGMVAMAHHLDEAQRNGGSKAYEVVFMLAATLVASSAAAWTIAAATVLRRTRLSRAVMLVEVVLSGLVCTAMVVITVATAFWWKTVGEAAPGFYDQSPTAFAVILGFMSVGALAGLAGCARILVTLARPKPGT